jgi:hypothetical protein
MRKSILAGIWPRFQRTLLPTWQHALMVAAIAFATLVAYLYIVPNSEISAARAQISRLKANVSALERENAELLREIASVSDLKTLELRAARLGMAPARSAIYLRLTPTDAADQASARSAVAPLEDEEAGSLGDQMRQLDVAGIVERTRARLIQIVDDLVRRSGGQ